MYTVFYSNSHCGCTQISQPPYYGCTQSSQPLWMYTVFCSNSHCRCTQFSQLLWMYTVFSATVDVHGLLRHCGCTQSSVATVIVDEHSFQILRWREIEVFGITWGCLGDHLCLTEILESEATPLLTRWPGTIRKRNENKCETDLAATQRGYQTQIYSSYMIPSQCVSIAGFANKHMLHCQYIYIYPAYSPLPPNPPPPRTHLPSPQSPQSEATCAHELVKAVCYVIDHHYYHYY